MKSEGKKPRETIGAFFQRNQKAVMAAAAIFTLVGLEIRTGGGVSEFVKGFIFDSPEELKQQAILKSLWEQLAEGQFVNGTFEKQRLGNIPEVAQKEMLTAGGFDVQRGVGPDTITEHWRIVWNKDGTVKDVVQAEVNDRALPAVGVGPMLLEDTANNDTNERWDWGGISYKRNITPESYEAARAFFESQGMHAYARGEKVDATKLLAQAREINKHMTLGDIKNIILKDGRFVDERGIMYEVWVGKQGPVFHQVPSVLHKDVLSIDHYGTWHEPDGTKIEPKKS